MGAAETSVSVEEIQILVKANITDALAGMTKLRSELKKVLSAQLPNIQSQIAPARQLLDQYGNTIYSSAAKAQTAVQKAGDSVQKNAQTAKQAANAEKAALEAVAKEHERINALVLKQAAAHDAASAAASAEAAKTPATTGPAYPSATATEIFARRAQEAGSQTYFQPPALNAWDKFKAQYYTILDGIKAKLNSVGLYGNENSVFGGNTSAWSRVKSGLDKVKSATNQATTATKGYGNQVKTTTSKSGSLFGSLGQTIKRALISVAVYQGIRQLFSTIKQGIQDAVDAPEIENLFRVAFGKAGDQAAAFAEKLRSTLGVDVYEAKQMLGTFQEIVTSMGIGQGTAAKMSESLTLLSNDIASLYNVDPEQASENLQSALTGQWRAVRKYGYTLSEATIQQTAYKYGLAQTGAELTEQQKVIARYLTLVDQSKNAQGDMQRTLGTVANQLRVLKQNFTAAGRSIGSAFIPFIQAAVPWLNAFMIVLQRVGVQLSRWTYSLFGMNYDAEMKKQQQTVVTGLNAVSDAEDAAGDAAEKAGKKAERSVLGFDQLNKLQDPDKDKSTGAGTGSAGGLDFNVPMLDVSQGKNPAEILADRIQAAFAKIQTAIQPTIDAFHRFEQSLEPLKTFAAKGFEDFYNDFLVPLGKWAFGNPDTGFPKFFDILSKFNKDIDWSKINDALDTLWKALEPFAETVGGGLLLFMDNVLRPLGEWVMNDAVPAFLKILANAINVLNNIAKVFQPAGYWFLNTFLKPIAEWTGGIIVSVLNGIADALGRFSDWIQKHQGIVETIAIVLNSFATAWLLVNAAIAVWNIIGAIATGVTAAFGAAVAVLTSPITLVILAIGAVIAIVVLLVKHWDEVKEAGGKAWDWIKDKWNGAGEWFQGIFDKIKSVFKPNMISDAFGKAWDLVKSVWNGAGKWFGDTWNTIVSKFKPDMISDSFKKAWNALTSFKFKLPHITWTGGGPEAPDWAKTVLETLHLPSSLPKLNVDWYASGGVFNQKSIIGVGEYANASSNPEIVSPQQIMYETAYKANVEGNTELVSAMSGFVSQLVQAIRDYSGGNIYLDGKQITNNMVSHVNDQIKLTKKSPFLPA